MKKVGVLLLAMVLAVGTFTACGAKKSEGAAKIGLGVVSSLEKSKAAGEGAGLAQTDSVAVAVLVGADGKIIDCKVDAAQTKIEFSAEGAILTDKATVSQTKQEKGDAYGMKGTSGIGKEWNEQADAFAKYVIGKNLDEVKGIALNEGGVPTDADLTSSVTVHVNDIVEALEKAMTNARDLGADAGDKLGLGITTDISDSKDATADAAGLAQAYSTYVAVTTDASGKITSSFIDASQGKVNFDVAGAVTSDLAAPATKQELGEGYGMKKVSPIGKEWNEQADAFAKYVIGKTAAEVTGIALSEDGVATDSDLTSSVTMHVGPIMEVIAKAVANAK